MNRRALEKHLRRCGCFLNHHGGKHDIWVNAGTLAQAPVPRHKELREGTAKAICRILGVPFPSQR